MVDVSLPQVYVTIGSNSYSTYDATSGVWTEVSADASETFHAVQDDGYGGTFREPIGNTATADGITKTYASDGTLLSIEGIPSDLTAVVVANGVETLSEAWPSSADVDFGSVEFDLPDALIGTVETYKGVDPNNNSQTFYFDETGAYLGSAQFYTSNPEAGVTNGYGVEFYDADDNGIGHIRYNMPDDGPVTLEVAEYTEVAHLESDAPVYWDASAYHAAGEAAVMSDGSSSTWRP